MKVKRIWIPAAVLAGALLATTANAHPGHGIGNYVDNRSQHGSYWKAPARSKRMPDWLYYKPHFRRWYRRSEIKYNRHLAWRQVYRIYQRRIVSRHHNRHRHHRDHYYYGNGHDPGYGPDYRGGRRDGRDERDGKKRRSNRG